MLRSAWNNLRCSRGISRVSSRQLDRALSRASVRDVFTRSSRRASTRSAPAKQAEKLAYPERLLVYHAGTGRTVFLGCTKLSTFFLFGFACLVVAPVFYNDPDSSQFMLPTVILGGAIPMLWVARATKPFVVYIHVVLPKVARTSRQACLKWFNTTKQDVELDMTTMRFTGLARTTRMRLGELRTRSETIGDVSNLVHSSAGASKRSIAHALLGSPRSFHVGNKTNHAKEPKLWDALYQRIQREQPKVVRRSPA